MPIVFLLGCETVLIERISSYSTGMPYCMKGMTKRCKPLETANPTITSSSFRAPRDSLRTVTGRMPYFFSARIASGEYGRTSSCSVTLIRLPPRTSNALSWFLRSYFSLTNSLGMLSLIYASMLIGWAPAELSLASVLRIVLVSSVSVLIFFSEMSTRAWLSGLCCTIKTPATTITTTIAARTR